MSSVLPDLLSNSLQIPDDKFFASIIGKSPSKGARSPRLWNAAYHSLGIDIQMYPFDVSPSNLEPLLNHLRSNPYFVGGCVAVPYKENVCQILSNNVTPEALAIGAVNSIFKNKKGELCGTNTDGEAAVKSLIAKVGSIEGKSVLILGGGGAGKSVCPYTSNAVGDNGFVHLACRTNFPSDSQIINLGITGSIEWRHINDIAPTIDILINCTSVGYADSKESSPVSKEELKLFTKTSIVYDIIYDPAQTMLLKYAAELGYETLNGLSMNLEQAVLAFGYAQSHDCENLSCDKIRSFMLKA